MTPEPPMPPNPGEVQPPQSGQRAPGPPSGPPEGPRSPGPPSGPPGGPPPGQPLQGPPQPPQGTYLPPYGGPPMGYAGADAAAPYGRHPMTGEPYSDKSKLVAGLLELFLGWVGAGRWYLGNTGMALAQLFTCGGLGIWALIDAIMMLTGNVRDQHGRPLRD